MEKRRDIRKRKEAIVLVQPLKNILFYTVVLIYLETLLHVSVYKGLDSDLIYPLLFSIPTGGFVGTLSTLFSEKVNHLLSIVFTALLSLWFAAQEVYYYVFKVFLSVYSIGNGTGKILQFYREIFSAIKANIIYIILFFLPVIFLAVYGVKKLSFIKIPLINGGILFLGNTLIAFVCVLAVSIGDKSMYSPHDLIYNNFIMEMSMKKLGNIATLSLDLRRTLWGDRDVDLDTDFPVLGEGKDDDTPVSEEPPYDTSPNILDINFDLLIREEKDEVVKNMHLYFQSQLPTGKNQYTGMFQGYNLIFLTAEGFSPYAVREDVTPTLYKLVNEGFVFKNFYNPIWEVSTSDGEYAATLGMIPKSGVWSMKESSKNYLPFSMGNQFRNLGYSTRAYHNHTYNYYRRDLSHPNLGYTYKGVGNGLKIKETWPESDLEMMEVTVPEFINDEKFHAYYMTVSGHLNYTFMGNSMSYKNQKIVQDLPYSEEGKAYIAANIELDKALEYLINSLEEAGKADKTVIVLSADHYPYGLPKENLDELAGHKVEENFELYKSNLIIWSTSMEKPIIVDKYCSSIDIIPTLSNLFGLEYDSRLLMGRDILSYSKPLVVFNNRSFITDDIMYNSKTGEIISLKGGTVTEEYISDMNKVVNNMFIYSAKVLEKNYYEKVLN
ncbi:LTA synthase family protein [Alloiococcus sp. CFN-8]|uniref:LTA synthase family protein n=1 Tax=Alloiococcus sp. CFN-8 TaxID=3416081 RepID=UPI003CF7EEC6